MSFSNGPQQTQAERDAALRVAARESLLRDVAEQQAVNERIAREQAEQDVQFVASGQQELRDRLYQQQAETRSAGGLGWIAALAALIAIGSIVWLMGKGSDQQARLQETDSRATAAQNAAQMSRSRAVEAETDAARARLQAQQAQTDAMKAQADAQQARLRAEQSAAQARQAAESAANTPATIIVAPAAPQGGVQPSAQPTPGAAPLEGRVEPNTTNNSTETTDGGNE
jgi:hypothetical protein